MALTTRIASPHSTIWGQVRHRQKLAEGVYSVETDSHEGVVVNTLVADDYLSDKAKAVIGGPSKGWWHFEGDCDVYIFANENRDIVPKEWLEYVDGGLKRWHEDYLTMTAEQILAKREAAMREADEAHKRYDAKRKAQAQLRQELQTVGWGGATKTYHVLDNLTVTVSEPVGGVYPCVFSAPGKESVNSGISFDILFTLLTA